MLLIRVGKKLHTEFQLYMLFRSGRYMVGEARQKNKPNKILMKLMAAAQAEVDADQKPTINSKLG